MHVLSIIGLCLVGLILYTLYHVWSGEISHDKSIPRIGSREGEIFSLWRSRIRNTTNYEAALAEAYEKYLSKGRTCLIPAITGDLTMLPEVYVDWLVNQPDTNLNNRDLLIETLASDYTLGSPDIARKPSHEKVIHEELTRKLGELTMDIMAELMTSFDDYWGSDTESWKTVNVYETMIRIIARTSNAILVGVPLCRNEELLDRAAAYAKVVPVAGFLLHLIPEPIRGMIAPLALWSHNSNMRKYARIMEPEIARRQADMAGQKPEAQRNDFLQWLIIRAETASDPVERTPTRICQRILAVQLAAIHTSTFTITNALYDLISAQDSQAICAELRQEAESVVAEEKGVWTKRGISKMIKIDSCLRESARMGSFITTSLNRNVMNPEGLFAPDGTRLPYRTVVATPAMGIHQDETNYTDAKEFRPFRFSEMRQESAIDGGSYIKKANLAFVSTSPTFQGFGHGRHACPGRFFAANELKLLIAYAVMNYEFEPLPTRPANKWMGVLVLPPMEASIRIKRRKESQI